MLDEIEIVIAGALGISGPIWRQPGRTQATAMALHAAASRLSATFSARKARPLREAASQLGTKAV